MHPPAPPDVDPNAWELASDPSGQFTCPVPRGWQRALAVHRDGANVAELIVASSGATRLTIGDPAIPMFTAAPAFPTPGIVPRPFTSIEHLLPAYAHQNFSGLPGYRPVGIQPDPALLQLFAQRVGPLGGGPVTAARLRFDHAGGSTVVLGATVALGPIWRFEVATVRTDGDPDAWAPVLMVMITNKRATPETQRRFAAERAASAAQHQATMASIHQNTVLMQQGHAQRMHDLHANAAAHQQRMDNLHASFDAANAAWEARQAAPTPTVPDDDASHRRFVEAIANEHTVVGPDGDTTRVQDGYDHYFRDRVSGTWVGLREGQALRDLGLDASRFDEWKIRR